MRVCSFAPTDLTAGAGGAKIGHEARAPAPSWHSLSLLADGGCYKAVGKKGAIPYRRILTPVDFDENSLRAVEIAAEFARQNDGTVFLVCWRRSRRKHGERAVKAIRAA